MSQSPEKDACHCGLDPQSPRYGIPRQARNDGFLRQSLPQQNKNYNTHISADKTEYEYKFRPLFVEDNSNGCAFANNGLFHKNIAFMIFVNDSITQRQP